jgi:hypothetical protein
LPELPALAERKKEVQWALLLETNGLTGEYLRWHEEERDRLSRIRRQGDIPGGHGSSDGPHETEADSVGIPNSVNLASARFEQLVQIYWPFWAAQVPLNSGTMVRWLETLRNTVAAEVKKIWLQGTVWHESWFERACEPAIRARLDTLVSESSSYARRLEIEWLEREIASGATRDRPRLEPRADPVQNNETSANAPASGAQRSHEIKRRGRKAKFSQEQLAKAQTLKDEGKRNQEVAKALYGASPTAAQRRSVPTILKHHRSAKNSREEK